MRRPPDRRHLCKRKEKTHLVQRRLWRQSLPELLRKQQRETPHLSHAQPLRRLKNLSRWRLDLYLATLQHGKRQRNHRMRRSEAPEIGDHLYPTLVPANLLHRRSRQHPAAKLSNSLGKIARKLVVAATQTVAVVASIGVLSLLLRAQGRHAHLAIIGSVEAFDISDDPAALLRRHLPAVQILPEA